jgi:4'-phosphopantetheinyl transferase
MSNVAFKAIPTGLFANVQLWLLDLNQVSVFDYQQLLSADEKARADRYLLPHLARRYIVGRGILRKILGQELGREPSSLEFTYGPQGKPLLKEPTNVFFNLSHSEEVALVAVGFNRRVGVDVERVDSKIEFMNIAKLVCNCQEQEMLLSLPETDRPAEFFRIWTMKEALLKGIGVGITYPLNKLDSDQLSEFSIIDGSTTQFDGPVKWTVHKLSVHCGFASAIAVEGNP